MSTGLIILNYNNYNDTIKCIESIIVTCVEKMPYVVIVDNFSTNDSVRVISEYLKSNNISFELSVENGVIDKKSGFTIIETTKNLGYAGGNNVGLNFLINNNFEFICVLNNDIVLTSNTIGDLTNCLDRNPEIGLLGPLLLKPNGEIDYNCCRVNPSNILLLIESVRFLNISFLNKKLDSKYILKSNKELLNQDIVPCDIVSGACIIAKRTTWETLKCFDQNTFLYYEENILFEKLKKYTSLKTAIFTKSSVIHLGAKSTSSLKNVNLMRIEIDSLMYYIKTYRKMNFLLYILIISIKKILVSVVSFKNILY